MRTHVPSPVILNSLELQANVGFLLSNFDNFSKKGYTIIRSSEKTMPRYPIGQCLLLDVMAEWTTGAQIEIRFNFPSGSGPKVLRGDLAFLTIMEGKLRMEFFWIGTHTGEGDQTTGWKTSSLAAYAIALTTQIIVSDIEGVWTLSSPEAEIKVEAAWFHKATGQFRLEKQHLISDSPETDSPA
jgi:hypothetical protein